MVEDMNVLWVWNPVVDRDDYALGDERLFVAAAEELRARLAGAQSGPTISYRTQNGGDYDERMVLRRGRSGYVWSAREIFSAVATACSP
jgi:hypothetical protein